MERRGLIKNRTTSKAAARQGEMSPCQRYYETFDIKSDRRMRYLVHNRTPKKIRIVDECCGELVLPPLAQRVIIGSRLAPFKPGLYRLRQRHQLRVRSYHRPHAGPRLASVAITIAVAALVGIVINDLLKVGTLERRDVFVSLVITSVLILSVLGVAGLMEWHRRAGEEVADADEGDIEFGMGGAFYDGNESLRRVQHIFTLLVVITIGAVLPAIAIFVATDAKDFLVMNGGLDVVDGKESQLVGRIIQVLYTAVLTLFPAILYFQFDRHRVGTIRSEWVRAIFRMDKRMETLADVNARYGDELAEASNNSTDSVRLLGGRNSPIIVATLLISLGWTLLVAQTGSFDFDRAGVDQSYFQFLVPTPSAAAMAFLGAYFFGTYLILRSYYRGDLRPKVYNQITARLITVVVLAYLIQTMFYNEENPYIWALSFLAGVVPTTVLQHVIDFASSFRSAPKRSVTADPSAPIDPDTPDEPITPSGQNAAATSKPNRLSRAFAEAFPTRRSLIQLDGVDVHDSTRLETEGITDVPSLATADLVSVMISTRLPVDRLVDWMDQAVLILLLDDDSNKELDARVKRLRRIGIRTASGVLAANAGELGAGVKKAAADIISSTVEGEPSDANTLVGIAAEIRREPAMMRILQWHQSELSAIDRSCPTITVANNGVDVVLHDISPTTHTGPTHPAQGHVPRIDAQSNTVLSHESPRPNGNSARHTKGATP